MRVNGGGGFAWEAMRTGSTTWIESIAVVYPVPGCAALEGQSSFEFAMATNATTMLVASVVVGGDLDVAFFAAHAFFVGGSLVTGTEDIFM